MQFPLLYAPNAEACHMAEDPAMMAFTVATCPCADGTMAAIALNRQIANNDRMCDINDVPFVVIGLRDLGTRAGGRTRRIRTRDAGWCLCRPHETSLRRKFSLRISPKAVGL